MIVYIVFLGVNPFSQKRCYDFPDLLESKKCIKDDTLFQELSDFDNFATKL